MFLIGTTSMYGREYPQNSSTSTILPSVKGISPFFHGVFTTLSLFSPTEKHDIVLVPEKGLHRFFLFVPKSYLSLPLKPRKLFLFNTRNRGSTGNRRLYPLSTSFFSHEKRYQSARIRTTPDIRKEEEKLSSILGGVLISTAERLIDHIRRGTFPSIASTGW